MRLNEEFLLVGTVDPLVDLWVLDAVGAHAVCKLPFVQDLLDLDQSEENEEADVIVQVETVPEG